MNREDSLDRAMRLFWQQGYHGTSIKDLEQALALHPGSIYAAFGSKSALYKEALDRYAQDLSEDLERCFAEAQSPLEGIRSYFRQVASSCSSSARDGVCPARACMVVKTILETGGQDRDIARHANRLLSRIERRFERALKEAQSRGDLRQEVNPRRLARYLQAQLMGLRAFAQRDIARGAVKELAEDIIKSIDSCLP
ncbi:MAG: TetR/AcrR family transcriptional regulator [Pseudomonadales bacterium]